MNTAGELYHNDKKKALLFLLAVPLLAIPFLQESEQQSKRESYEHRFKIIINFEMPKSQGEIKSYMDNFMQPDLENKLIELIQSNYQVKKIESNMEVYFLPDGKTLEMYPKFYFEGDSFNSRTTHDLKVNEVLDEMKLIIQSYLESNGATNIKFYIDRPQGEEVEILSRSK